MLVHLVLGSGEIGRLLDGKPVSMFPLASMFPSSVDRSSVSTCRYVMYASSFLPMYLHCRLFSLLCLSVVNASLV